MKKFFKNLAIWWGWMSYGRPFFTFFVALFTLTVSMALIFKQPWLFLIGLVITVTLLILGNELSDMSRNWRVAVAEAEKMAEDPEGKYAFAHHTLWNYIQSTRLNKSGKDLYRITQLLQKHHELNAQLLSFEQERNKLDVEHDKVLNERNGIAKELSTLFS